MSKAREEQIKLKATYANGLAIALFAVGGLAPLFSNIYTRNEAGTDLWIILAVSVICFVVSYVLHLVGRRTLRGLDQ